MVIRYRDTPPPSLAVANGSAHTHVIMSLSSEVVMEAVMMTVGDRTLSVKAPPTCG